MSARIPLTLILVALAAVLPARAAERIERRDFSASPGTTLKIDTYRGGIDVTQSPDEQMHVEIRIDPGTDDRAEADRILQTLQLDIRQAGSVISITARNPTETVVHFAWQKSRKVLLSYAVTMPPACNLDLTTDDGGVAVQGIMANVVGNMDVKARKGGVFFRSVEGNIKAIVDTGDIVVSRCTGSVDLKATVGSIRVGTVGGFAELRVTNGDIELQHALGGAKVAGTAGEILVGFPKTLNRDSSVSSDGGSIVVRLDPAVHCTIQASAVWGRVQTTLPITVEAGGDGKKSLKGRLNGGGALLKLHADGGNLRIEPPPI